MKQAVIPFVGRTLHVPFDTITQSDLRLIKERLEVVEGNQEKKNTNCPEKYINFKFDKN